MADDLKIALRIQADIEQAKKELNDLIEQVDHLGAAGEKAGAGVAGMGNSVADAETSIASTAGQTENLVGAVGNTSSSAAKLGDSMDKIGSSAKTAGAGVTDLGGGVASAGNSLADTAAQTDTLIAAVDNTSSSAADLDDSMDRIDRSAKDAGTSTSRFGGDVTRVIKDLKDFESANNGAINSLQDIADQEQRVDRLFASGMISLEEYEDALVNLDKAEAGLNKQTSALVKEQEKETRELEKLVNGADRSAAELRKLDAAAEALEQAFKDNKITVDQYNGALAGIAKRRAEIEATGDSIGRMGLRSKEARSQIITMTRSLADGNFESAATDLLRLASNADKSGTAFLKLAIPIGAVVTAVGAFAAISYQAFKDQRELENALLLTNNAAGLTEASFGSISRAIEQNSNATIGQAEEITLALARTGKFSSDVIASYGRTIAALTQVTGKSAEDLAGEFAEMEGSIADWAAKQNETWRFLTAAQYENIRAMEQRGDVEGAQLAISEALNDRYATAVTERLGTIESAWVKLRKAASDYWRFAKDITSGDDGSDAQLLERRQSQLEQRINVVRRTGGDPDTDSRVMQYRQEIFDLQSLVRETEQEVQTKSDEARQQAETIAAQRRIQDLTVRNDRAKQMQAELDKLTKDFEAARRTGSNDPAFSQENQQRQETSIRKKYEDRPDASITAAENYVKTLEKQSSVIALTAEELELQRIAELNLTEEQQRRVETAQTIIDKEKERLVVAKDEKTLTDLRIELYRAQGREFEATNLEIDQQYGELIKRLQVRNDTADIDLVNQLIDLEKLKSRLDNAQEQINQVLSDQQQQETSINAQREAGLVTEIEARKRIVDLHKQTLAELEKQRPVLAELAKQPGAVGEAAAKSLAGLNAQALQLQATTDLFSATVKNSLEDGLADVIGQLAQGTLSFGDAIKSLAQTVANAIIQIQAQQIAQSIVGGGGSWMSTALGFAGAFFGGGGAGAASGASGAVEGGLVLTAATGGHVTGPGTGTSDSIPAMLSNNEYVTRSAVVAQQGALDFLHDFNRRGMAALNDWSPAHHANGGLAGVPAPDMPSPTLGVSEIPEPAAAFSAEVANNFQFNLIDDPQRIADSMQSRAGEESLTVVLSRNPAKFRALLGVSN